MKNLFDLPGRVAVVTGGTSGIGLSMAKDLAEAGADVMLASVDKEGDREAAAAEIRKIGRRAAHQHTDVRLPAECEKLMKNTVSQFGKIDILVNSAGMNQRGPLIETVEEQYDKILDTDLKGLFFCSLYAAKEMMKQKKGRIVNITSCAVEIAVPLLGLYCAAKAGAGQLTKACAIEWAQYGINVNAIGPYYVETKLNADFLAIKANYDAIASKTSLKKLSKTSDLTGALLLLVSDAGNYITGQTIYIDGGALAGWQIP